MTDFWERKRIYTRTAKVAFTLQMLAMLVALIVALAINSFWPLPISWAVSIGFFLISRRADRQVR